MSKSESASKSTSGSASNRSGWGDRVGFTLMELMIVIVIIGIIVAIVAPRMVGALDESNVAAAKAQIRNFKTALLSYRIKFNKYPSTAEGLNALINNAKEPFLDSSVIPKDPWGNEYVYRCPGSSGREYDIVSYGRDGQPGGTGYDADIESWNLQAKN